MTDYFTIGKNDISDIYSRIRAMHQRELAERRQRIYQQLPELASLDRELTHENASSLRRILTLSPDAAAKVKQERLVRIRPLQEKRSALLLENRIPETDLELTYDCPLCKDEGIVDGQRCSCYQKHMLKLLYRQSSLGDVLEKENFETFSFDQYSDQPVDGNVSPRENVRDFYRQAKDFATTFSPEGKSFLFYGGAGIGKTFLSNCIAKQLMDTGHSVLYVTANELFNDILSAYLMYVEPDTKERLKPVYELVYKADLLVLDDLGTELTNTFTLSQLFEVINRRMISGKSTIISTNLSLRQMRDRYQDRIVSRIVDRYEICHFYGDNIRSKRKADNLKKGTQ